MTERIGGIDFIANQFGMLRQCRPHSFQYDEAYLARQSTNLQMSYLRLGWLLAEIPYELLRRFHVLELGPGTGIFFEAMKNHVCQMSGFDVVETSPYCTVRLEEARRAHWDLLCAFDVLEHFEEIDALWELDFSWGYFSIPAPPRDGITSRWRHFKPDEHLWYITAGQFAEWAAHHGYRVVAHGTPEDCIRTRWDVDQANINSFLVRKRVPTLPDAASRRD